MRPRVPPGPSSRMPGRILFEFQRDPLRFLEAAERTYGDIVHFKLGPLSYYLVTRPDLVKNILLTDSHHFTKGRAQQRAKIFLGEGLVTSEDPLHARQRRLMQRSFNRQHLTLYAQAMVGPTETLRSSWRDGETRDLNEDMIRVTVAIVIKTLFNREVTTESEAISNHIRLLQDHGLFFYLAPRPALLLKLPIPPMRRLAQAIDYMNAYIDGVVAERRKSGENPGDILSTLLHAQDADDGAMTDRQIRDECISMFTAGYETTANTLSWALHLVMQHPDVEDKLFAEVRSVLDGRAPTIEDVPRLAYAKMVLSEALRLYPPLWAMARSAAEDYELDGYTIPARSILLVSPWIIHRKAAYFPEPNRFNPERWNVAGAGSQPAFSYFPFGGGPRSCIGEGFAWTQALIILSMLVQRWTFELAPGHIVKEDPKLTLRQKYGLRAVVRRRVDGKPISA